jgi:hypothetical protein
MLAQPDALQVLLTRPLSPRARGTRQGAGRRIVLKLDDATFERVSLLAAASGVPFAEAVRQLVVRGLLSNARADNARRRVLKEA